MSKRSLLLYGTVAILGCAGGATFAIWSSNDNLAVPAIVTSLRGALPHYHSQHATTYSNSDERPLTMTRALNLKLTAPLSKSGAATLDTPATSANYAEVQPSRAKKNTTRQSERTASLDLKLPDEAHSLASKGHDVADDHLPRLAVAPEQAALDLQPKAVTTPHVKSYSLFNPDYGLRGFMTQSWLNQHFGIQGGLGLNDDRLIKTDSTLRDDIAVGMGVVLAF